MARQSKLKKIGPIEGIEIPGKPGGPLVIFFHGYGSDATDLVSLANVIKAPSGATWIFPQGTIEVLVDGNNKAQAWFQTDVKALEKATAEGRHLDIANTTPGGMKNAREKIFQLVEELKVPWSNVILGGFSQGAMLATMTALMCKEMPKGLIILSGALIDQRTWIDKAKTKVGLKFFQSHGTEDEILSLDGALKLEKVLTDAGLKGRLQSFEGGHEIPQEVISGINRFIASL